MLSSSRGVTSASTASHDLRALTLTIQGRGLYSDQALFCTTSTRLEIA